MNRKNHNIQHNYCKKCLRTIGKEYCNNVDTKNTKSDEIILN